MHWDNAFPPRGLANEGEGGELKLGDGEEGFEFFVRERGSGTGVDRRKEGIKGFEVLGLFFWKRRNCM